MASLGRIQEFNQLVETLAEVYSFSNETFSLIETTGLKYTKINFDQAAKPRWSQILKAAYNQNRLDEILQAVYQDNPKLKETIEPLHQTMLLKIARPAPTQSRLKGFIASKQLKITCSVGFAVVFLSLGTGLFYYHQNVPAYEKYLSQIEKGDQPIFGRLLELPKEYESRIQLHYGSTIWDGGSEWGEVRFSVDGRTAEFKAAKRSGMIIVQIIDDNRAFSEWREFSSGKEGIMTIFRISSEDKTAEVSWGHRERTAETEWVLRTPSPEEENNQTISFQVFSHYRRLDLSNWHFVPEEHANEKVSLAIWTDKVKVQRASEKTSFCIRHATTGIPTPEFSSSSHQVNVHETTEVPLDGPKPKLRVFDVCLDVSNEPVNHWFDVELVSKYWNALNNPHTAWAATPIVNPTKQLTFEIQFPEGKPLKRWERRAGARDTTTSELITNDDARVLEDRRVLRWKIENPQLNWVYKFNWEW